MGTISLRQSMHLGNPNGLELRVIALTEHQKRQTTDTLCLQVASETGECLMLKELDFHALDTVCFEEIFSLIAIRLKSDRLRATFIPHIRPCDLGHTMYGHMVQGSCVYIRLMLGHAEQMKKLDQRTLWHDLLSN